MTGSAAGPRQALLLRIRDRAERDERGTTLVELMVGMVIMSICGAIFTSAVVSLSRTSNQTQAITDATSQNNRVFQTLDRTVRYASAVSTPGQGTGTGRNWYVELRDTSAGTEVCTQLRIDNSSNQLQRRTWPAANPGAVSAWTPLASGITNGTASAGASQPFLLPTQGASAIRQRLQITTVATSGPANQRSSTTSSYTLTAQNSTQPPASTAICQQVARP